MFQILKSTEPDTVVLLSDNVVLKGYFDAEDAAAERDWLLDLKSDNIVQLHLGKVELPERFSKKYYLFFNRIPANSYRYPALLLERFGTSLTYEVFRTLNQRSIVHQILLALAELHRRGVVHLDLNPRSILQQDGRIKLCDFVSAFRAGTEVDFPSGTVAFRAPEIQRLACESYPYYIVHPSADVWSLGCTLICLLDPEFPNRREAVIRKMYIEYSRQLYIKHLQKSCGIFANMIIDCLEFDPCRRPTIPILLDRYQNLFSSTNVE